ncbi:MAG: Lrp/AsnC family transcriptional regulator [Clostridia bacterium]|nr:Lrp/AsnC family transcriptional regulator [Clostridia bacterium]
MDSIDLKILHHLKENARAKASAIGDSIKLSVSAVTERIKRMEQAGIIRQYTVIIDQKKIGNGVSAIMEVALEHPQYADNFIAMVMALPNIVSCDCVTGDFDYILQIVTDSTDGLEEIYRTVRSFEGVSVTKTHLILRRVKNEHTVIPNN